MCDINIDEVPEWGEKERKEYYLRIKAERIEQEVKSVELYICKKLSISPEFLRVKRTKRENVEKKYVAFYYILTHSKINPYRLSLRYGFEHGSILHAMETVENLIETNRSFREKYEKYLINDKI